MEADDASRRTTAREERTRITRRASAAASTHSNRSNNSSKASKNGVGPPTPESPQVRVTRKRTAENTDDIIEIDDVSPQQTSPSHTRGSSGDSRDSTKSVCLCQPDPKIPRPRNAFILYRQHHQAAVAAQNPGLANPDISKIIGEQWRSQPVSIKNEWKQLAEEEKLRHQQQYPEYRYRPRRSDRRGSVSEHGVTKDLTAERTPCQKCGGRSLPTTSPNGPSAMDSASPGPVVSRRPATPVTRYLPKMNTLSLASPHSRRSRVAPAGLHINVAASRQRVTEDVDSSLSPDTKRRRYNIAKPTYMLGRAPAGPVTPYYIPSSHSSVNGVHPPRESLPPPTDLLRTSPPHSASLMALPPTPRWRPTLPSSPYHQDPGRDSSWERASLTLPPLQSTRGPGSLDPRPIPAAPTDNGSSRERRSVEAMVMNMSFMGKLKILRKIAPPVGTKTTSGDPAPSKSPRGALVAIEGFNRHAVSEMTGWLESFLSKLGEHEVRTWDGPNVPSWHKTAMIGEFLEVVRDWHRRSDDIVESLKMAPVSASVPEVSRARSTDDQPEQSTPTTDEIPYSGTTQSSSAVESAKSLPSSTKIPVALVKTYMLQACDRYACSIPIGDAYSPADHWQWMATLWRGIPGADITIYVKEVDTTANNDSSERMNGTTHTPVRAAVNGEKAGTVEIIEEGGVKCLLVWKEKNQEVEGSALRRLGFELSEWIREYGTK